MYNSLVTENTDLYNKNELRSIMYKTVITTSQLHSKLYTHSLHSFHFCDNKKIYLP